VLPFTFSTLYLLSRHSSLLAALNLYHAVFHQPNNSRSGATKSMAGGI